MPTQRNLRNTNAFATLTSLFMGAGSDSDTSGSEGEQSPSPSPTKSSQSALSVKKGKFTFVRNSKQTDPVTTIFGGEDAKRNLQPSAEALAAAATKVKTTVADAKKKCDAAKLRMAANPAPSDWLRAQSAIGVDCAIKAAVLVDIGGGQQVTRNYVFFNSRAITEVRVTHALAWKNALNDCEVTHTPHTGSSGHTGGKGNRSTVRIAVFSRSTRICLEAARPDGKFDAETIATPFPPVEHQLICQVVSLQLLSPVDAKVFRDQIELKSEVTLADVVTQTCKEGFAVALSADECKAAAARGANAGALWEQHPRTDADVDRACSNFGKRGPTHRDLDVKYHTRFRSLCEEAARGPDLVAALRRVITIPSTLLRKAPSYLRTSHAATYMAAQLAGNVCTPDKMQAAVEAQRASIVKQVRAKNPSLDEQIEDNASAVNRVISLVARGKVAEAAKRLKDIGKPPPAKQPLNVVMENLVPLHPKGTPPVNVTPPLDLYSETVIPLSAIILANDRKCNFSAPGPSGWTPELLRIALGSTDFAVFFRNIIIAACNGTLPPDADALLSMSNIIGIPKDSGGTRPIAMGEVFMKIAADIAIQRCSEQLKAFWKGRQFGVSYPNGADTIIHSTRAFAREGTQPHTTECAGPDRVILLLDAKNAFNMPHREAMHQAIRKAAPGLLGIFKTAYAQHGVMYVVGSNGEHTISSECGARQGTVDGSCVFSILLQPALDDIDENVVGASVRAYLDDATIVAADLKVSEKAVNTYNGHLTSHGAALQPKKCELFMPGLVREGDTQDAYEARVRAALDAKGIPASSKLREFKIASCVKLLGASIATTDKQEQVHFTDRIWNPFADRMKQLELFPACPQAIALLRSCIIPALGFSLRVHAPAVTKAVALSADANVAYLFQQWGQTSPLGEHSLALLHAPRKDGGLGVPSLAATAPAAHFSSVTAANGNTNAPSQRHIMQAANTAYYNVLRDKHPELADAFAARASSNGGLCAAIATRTSEELMGAAIRLSLNCASETCRNKTATLPCPGCGNSTVGRIANNIFAAALRQGNVKLYTHEAFAAHAVGCASTPGGYITKRHNGIRDLVAKLLGLCGYAQVVVEPRNLRNYDCGCTMKGMAHDAYVIHQKTCGQATAKARSHGPDILYTDLEGNLIALDIRVCNEFCEAHRGKPIGAVFAHAEAEKKAKYGELCAGANVALLTICVSAQGALSNTTKGLLKSIARDSGMDLAKLATAVSGRACVGTAMALLNAESLAGTRPAPRTISRAILKMLENSHGLEIGAANFDIGGKPRLGIPSASSAEIDALVARAEQLLSLMAQHIGAVLVNAATLQQAEADELKDAMGTTRVQRLPSERRLPSASPAPAGRLPLEAAAAAKAKRDSQRLRASVAASEARAEMQLNVTRSSATAAIEAAYNADDIQDTVEQHLDALAAETATLESEAARVLAKGQENADQIAAVAAKLEAESSSTRDQIALIKSELNKRSSQNASVAAASKRRDDARASIDRAHSEAADAIGASQRRHSVAIDRCEEHGSTLRALRANTEHEVSVAQRECSTSMGDLCATARRNGSVSNYNDGGHSPIAREPVAVLGPSGGNTGKAWQGMQQHQEARSAIPQNNSSSSRPSMSMQPATRSAAPSLAPNTPGSCSSSQSQQHHQQQQSHFQHYDAGNCSPMDVGFSPPVEKSAVGYAVVRRN